MLVLGGWCVGEVVGWLGACGCDVVTLVPFIPNILVPLLHPLQVVLVLDHKNAQCRYPLRKWCEQKKTFPPHRKRRLISQIDLKNGFD